MKMNVLLSVFKRDFVSYFTSPLGYVFVWLFVFLGTIAAFWPNDFFNANLANLNQLNFWFPFIMLAFVPAITMSVWAEERRQGTDELLLTIPVTDFDVVLGKYLAAVAIYTVSLLFSLLCNYAVLETLGSPDVGLLLGTYFGYWFIGLAMLAVGMAGSFLTRNLTMAFILGALFNAPLVLGVWAESVMPPAWAAAVRSWSIGHQFADFGSGVISLSSMVYFAGIVAVMLYLCMVLIGRRHWSRGTGWAVQAGHFSARTGALATMAVCAILAFDWRDARLDVTSERLNSLSPQTVRLIRDLQPEHPIRIEAFISPQVPEAYVQTKANLESTLREIRALGGEKIQVQVHSTERFSEEAAEAEKLYEIRPRQIRDLTRGAVTTNHIFMGVAVTHGPERRIVLPFVDRGIPVEYELVRSVATVTDQERRRIGVVDTDAPLFGRFSMQAMTPGQDWPIVAELQKQYDVVRIDPNEPITEEVDALLVVQPSSLGPDGMDHFIAAVASGIPTAVFEDPFPIFAPNVPATSMPRNPPQNPMMPMQQQQHSLPKGDIDRLWRLLGIDFAPDYVVWQDYNPYRQHADIFPEEFVFVDEGAGAREPFNRESRISGGLQQVLFPFPGAVAKLHASDLDFKPLARTGTETGSVRFDDLISRDMFGRPAGLNANPRRRPSGNSYVLAARIRGEVDRVEHRAEDAPPVPAPAAEAGPGAGALPPELMQQLEAAGGYSPDAGDPGAPGDPGHAGEPAPARPRPGEIDVVVVADLDMLTPQFFQIREEGQRPEAGFYFDFDNVTFVLNSLDALAGDDRFVDIRSRRPKYRTLKRIERQTEQARERTATARERLRDGFEQKQAEEQEKLDREIERLRERMQKERLGSVEIAHRVQTVLRDGQRRLEVELERAQQEMDREVDEIETALALEVRRVQDAYKFWAVALPPIPPLLLAVIVFFTRRIKEREGVAKTRLR